MQARSSFLCRREGIAPFSKNIYQYYAIFHNVMNMLVRVERASGEDSEKETPLPEQRTPYNLIKYDIIAKR